MKRRKGWNGCGDRGRWVWGQGVGGCGDSRWVWGQGVGGCGDRG